MQNHRSNVARRATRKSLPPLPIAEAVKPFYAKRSNVTGMPRQNIEEAFADARAMGLGARVVDSKGTVMARWVNAGGKAWWKAMPETSEDA